ncbi:MAG: hypothetical protein WAO76_00485 [Georgfuchsia sp.]
MTTAKQTTATQICDFLGVEKRGLRRLVITLDPYSGHKVECEYFLLPLKKSKSGDMETVVRHFELKEVVPK